MSHSSPDGGEAEVETVEGEALPYVFVDGRVDFNYPAGLLEIHEPEFISTQVILVSLLEEQTLVALPQAAWHRLRAHRQLPLNSLSKATLVEVAVAEPDDRHTLSSVENSLKVWLGFLRADLVALIQFLEEEEGLHEQTLTFAPDGTAGIVPYAQALVDVARDHFAFFSALEKEPELPESGSPDLTARVATLEETLSQVAANMQELLNMQKTAAPAGTSTKKKEPASVSAPVKSASPPTRKIDQDARNGASLKPSSPVAAYPLLDQAVVRSALQAGVPSDVLQEMQTLMAAAGPAKRLKEHRAAPPKVTNDLSESEDEDPQAAASGLVDSGLNSQDPMTQAVVKLTDIMSTLTADKRKKKAGALETALDGVHGSGGDGVSSGAGRRSAIARRALMKALTTSPQELSQIIERNLLEDLAGRTRTPGQPEPTFSARAWVEHRSFIGAYKTLAHAAWGVSAILDCLVSGKIEEGRARAGLLLLQLDQTAADRGNWQLAATLSLEPQPPFTVLAQHHPPDTAMGEQPFSKLLDPRWAEVALAHLKDTEEYLEKRKKLQRGALKKEEALYRRGLARYRMGDYRAARPDLDAALQAITEWQEGEDEKPQDEVVAMKDVERRVRHYLVDLRRFHEKCQKIFNRKDQKPLYDDRPDVKEEQPKAASFREALCRGGALLVPEFRVGETAGQAES
eukprot:g6323.t1